MRFKGKIRSTKSNLHYSSKLVSIPTFLPFCVCG